MDSPASWQEAWAEARSHDSRRYGARVMLRLDDSASLTLQGLVERFHVSRTDIIRQLIAQANPADFPKSWHLRAAERRARQARRVQHGVDHEA